MFLGKGKSFKRIEEDFKMKTIKIRATTLKYLFSGNYKK